MLQLGQPITDLETGESRFRLVELLARGDNHDIAIAEDLHLDDKRVVVKAIRYVDPTDRVEVEARRAALENELRALTLPSALLPEPLDWLRIRNENDFAADSPFVDSEPLLVYELQHGKPLIQKIDKLAPEGVETARALGIVHELAFFLASLHEHERICRVLDADKVIMDVDDILHVVGLAGSTRIGAEVNASYASRDSGFVAPELREAPRADLIRPAGDVYSLGAVLSYLLTGRRPLRVVESPFDDLAFHRLGAHGAGVARLVARMLAPDPARRFQTIGELLPLIDPHRSPDPEHPALAGVRVPSPWSEPPAVGPARQNRLSPGPLVATPPAESAQAAPADAETSATPPGDTDQPPARVEPTEDALARRWTLVSYGMAATAGILILIVALLALL